MFDFESLHKNHKYAYADGFLTAIAFVWLYRLIKRGY